MAEEQTVITRDAPKIEAYKLGLMELAKRLSEREPSGGLPRYRAAGVDPLQQAAFDRARLGAFEGTGYLDSIQNQLQGLRPQAISQAARAGMPLMQSAATGLRGIGTGFDPTTGVGSFFNPFQQQVVDRTLDDLRRQSNIAAQRDDATAVASGAFGGSRKAILDAERERNLLDKQASIAGQLRATGYQDASTRAQKAYEDAMKRRLAGVQLGGDLGMNIGRLGMAGEEGALSAALKGLQTQSGIGELAQQMQLRGLEGLSTLGTTRRDIEQQQLDAQRQSGLQDVYEPYQRLGFYSDILRGVPTSQQTLTSSTAPKPTYLSQLVGAAGTGLGLYGAAKGSNII